MPLMKDEKTALAIAKRAIKDGYTRLEIVEDPRGNWVLQATGGRRSDPTCSWELRLRGFDYYDGAELMYAIIDAGAKSLDVDGHGWSVHLKGVGPLKGYSVALVVGSSATKGAQVTKAEKMLVKSGYGRVKKGDRGAYTALAFPEVYKRYEDALDSLPDWEDEMSEMAPKALQLRGAFLDVAAIGKNGRVVTFDLSTPYN
jgi:hypothetical protein